MNPLLEFPKPTDPLSVTHDSPILLLGSCFSTHLNAKLKRAGFTVESNPFGVVFHPIPLARFISESLAETTNERTLLHNDIWLSWDASSELYALSESELITQLQTIRFNFKRQLQSAQLLVITLGSAHEYRLKSTSEVVANCHKQAASGFEKKITSQDHLLEPWIEVIEQLKSVNPNLKIVFTVSPIRYSRDGWVENNRSKARLFELVEQLQSRYEIAYFPSFELINDVLRDYRYFETDGVHPNSQAIEQVWNLFQSWYFEEKTAELVWQVEALRRMEEHRLLFPESVKSQQFLDQFQQKRESFLSLHPTINW